MGHSIGHWDGDTLVVDTIGFNDLAWIFSQGRVVFPQTKNLRVTERFRRLDVGRLEVERTFDDPGYLRQPFTTTEVKDLAHTKSEQ
jgi:hypothetical protein